MSNNFLTELRLGIISATLAGTIIGSRFGRASENEKRKQLESKKAYLSGDERQIENTISKISKNLERSAQDVSGKLSDRQSRRSDIDKQVKAWGDDAKKQVLFEDKDFTSIVEKASERLKAQSAEPEAQPPETASDRTKNGPTPKAPRGGKRRKKPTPQATNRNKSTEKPEEMER
ncbi:hypothetical protein [Nocardiopsis sp. SBT366]|jgi:uncharacterized protein YhaN|uniref:hypothetical protein n=1 Tax=Nocardiopsis sp. SBT366 TaxID=1580529 RepID=UPI000AE8D474|nr:hypothetical protein [Nocardiopsis sp. SBT366]